MNAGSRVRTHAGDGTVIRIDIDDDWSFGKPHRRAWVLVEHDDGRRLRLPANSVEELDEIEWPE